MSIQSWLDEFCHKDTFDNLDKKSDKTLVELCLFKWKGLLKRNLDKHNCYTNEGYIKTKDPCINSLLAELIGGDLCHLCLKYPYNCIKCPLHLYTDNCSSEFGPYSEFIKNNNPLPMIDALEQCLNGLEDE